MARGSLKNQLFILALVGMLSGPTSVVATTCYVSPAGSGTTCSTSSPCSLKYALESAAANGDTVKIMGGNYIFSDGVAAAVVTGKSSVTLGGSYDSRFRTQSISATPTVVTTPQGGWLGAAFLFQDCASILLDKVRFDGAIGFPLRVVNSQVPVSPAVTAQYCQFQGASGHNSLEGTYAVIQYCSFSGNSGIQGKMGVPCKAEIRANVFKDSWSNICVVSVMAGPSSEGQQWLLHSNAFINNYESACINEGTALVLNNTFVGGPMSSSCPFPNGLYWTSWEMGSDVRLEVRDNVFKDICTYSDIGETATLEKNLYFNCPFPQVPGGVGEIVGVDPLLAPDQYHLNGRSSPCYDRGVTLSNVPTDIDSQVRPRGKGYDIGADEY